MILNSMYILKFLDMGKRPEEMFSKTLIPVGCRGAIQSL